jgi:hypothetical protein
MNARALLFALFILFIEATSASAFTPRTGTWWNPNESGSGYNIEIHQGVLVITVYSYKSNGDSEWYLASGPMSADQRQFTGTLDKYRNGQCISCAYRVASLVGNDGTISINFSSETSATLTLPGGRLISIQAFFPPATSLNGTYRLARSTVDFLGGPLYDSATGDFEVSGTMVIADNQVTQSVMVTVNGTTISISQSASLTDYGAYIVLVVQNGTSGRAALIVRGGSLLVMESINPAEDTAPPFSEVDQWELVASGTVKIANVGPAAAKDGAQVEPDRMAPRMGGAVGSALMTALPPT